ncbi:SWIM-type domain-containing protein [Haematococcus lacustris]|uniref:SWIM-type domain-containing protein n=1 Tax=Haematococcus lacustris TaxID=44745 RepID=A0A699ZMA7_HAELA|nr:SWIM-type domain-containing protein [Haematococcus lacustris]
MEAVHIFEGKAVFTKPGELMVKAVVSGEVSGGEDIRRLVKLKKQDSGIGRYTRPVMSDMPLNPIRLPPIAWQLVAAAAQVSSIGNEAWAELQAMRPSAQAPQVHCNRVSQNCLPAVAVTISTGQQLPSAAAADMLCCHDAVRIAARHGAWLGQSWTNLLPAFGGGVEGPYNQRRAWVTAAWMSCSPGDRALPTSMGATLGKPWRLLTRGLLLAYKESRVGVKSSRQVPPLLGKELRNLTEVVQVQGKTAADKYLVFPAHFCSCQAFFYEVVNKGEAVCCKHQLAARVSWSLQRCPVLVVSDVQLAQFLINAS